MASRESILAACLSRLEWSPERLASEINRVCGLGTISRKSPYGWLQGSCPRGRLPQVVAEILSTQLGIHVAVDDLWPDRTLRPLLDLPADSGFREPWTPEGMSRCAEAFARNDLAVDLRFLRPLDRASLNAHATSWLITPGEPVRSRLDGELITPDMIDAIEVRVGDLRRMDDMQGGTVVLDWAGHDLKWATGLIRRGAYDETVGRRLHVVVAELAQLAGWLACDAERHATAQRYWLLGLRAAHAADDRQLGANILSCLSYQATWNRRGTQALDLIRIASTGVRGHASGAVQALLSTRRARAHAVLGDSSSCERAIDDAMISSESCDRAPDPPWSYWITPAVLAADAGRAWLDLGYPDRAEGSLLRGLELFGDAQPRNRLLHNASLAEARLARAEAHGTADACLARAEVDGAAEAAHAALDLAAVQNSRRATARLGALHAPFSRIDAVAAREVADRILSVVAG